MANKKISDGVGKKIVEALKKQSEIEVNPIAEEGLSDEFETLSEDLANVFDAQQEIAQDVFEENDFLESLSENASVENFAEGEEIPNFSQTPSIQQPTQSFVNYPSSQSAMQDNFMSELDSFEIPNNIAVLKKLITQLPSGVTRHTGAQIIKQTMEALGISMKSVLQEAQQVQEGLNNSAKDCYSTIQDYKKQILTLEKQAQNYQKQYAALNELISLFIQTGV